VTEKKVFEPGRRQFLVRAGKACGSIATTGAVSWLFYDRQGPGASEQQRQFELPDFSVKPQTGPVMSVVRGSKRAETVRLAIKALGGIQRFVKAGDRIVIKPNVAFASPAAFRATAAPELVAEVVRLSLVEAQARQVIVTDNPINNPSSCFMLSGIGKAASASGAKILLPKRDFFERVTLAGGRLIKNWPVLYEPLKGADKLIGIAVVKDHHRSVASMAMKNWYGLLGGRRNIFHQDINTIIAELAVMVKPTLVILDGTEVMVTNGPTGGSLSDLKRKDTMIASCDMVAADAYGCGLLGLKPDDLPYLQKAAKAGAGTVDWQSLKPEIITAV